MSNIFAHLANVTTKSRLHYTVLKSNGDVIGTYRQRTEAKRILNSQTK